MELFVQFIAPDEPISMNEGDSWAVRKKTAIWRDRATYAWIEAHPGLGPRNRRFGGPAEIFTVLPFAMARRRDPINFSKTVKHIVDGFVTAGAWPDDTLDYVTQHIPTLVIDRTGRNVVTVRVVSRAVEPATS